MGGYLCQGVWAKNQRKLVDRVDHDGVLTLVKEKGWKAEGRTPQVCSITLRMFQESICFKKKVSQRSYIRGIVSSRVWSAFLLLPSSVVNWEESLEVYPWQEYSDRFQSTEAGAVSKWHSLRCPFSWRPQGCCFVPYCISDTYTSTWQTLDHYLSTK